MALNASVGVLIFFCLYYLIICFDLLVLIVFVAVLVSAELMYCVESERSVEKPKILQTVIGYLRGRTHYFIACGLLAYLYYLVSEIFEPLSAGKVFEEFRSRSTSWFYKWLSSRGLSRDSVALLNALYTGDKTQLHGSFRDMIRASGLSHLFALSGFHLEICVTLLSLLLRPVPQRLRMSMTLIIVWLYCWWVAFPASLVRAATMSTVRYSVQKRQIHYGFVYVCAVSFLICLVTVPRALESVSLILSFLAVLGVRAGLVFSKTLYRYLPVILADMLGIGIGVTACTAWYVFIIFGQVHIIGILATLVASPMVVLVMYLGLLILSMPFQSIVRGFVYVFDFLTDLLILLCVGFANVGAIKSLFGLGLLYCVLLVFVLVVGMRAKKLIYI